MKYLLISITLILIVSCTSKECQNSNDVELKLLIDYTPVVDTFLIGDTLTISSIFSDMISDVNSGDTLEAIDFEFHTIVILRRFQDNSPIDLNTDVEQIVNENMEYEIINFSSTEGSGISIPKHNYQNNIYDFNFGYVFQDTGLYIVAGDTFIGLTEETSRQQFTGQCPDQEVNASYYRSVGSKNENLELYNYHWFDQIEFLDQFTEDDFKKFSWYAFYVKD